MSKKEAILTAAQETFGECGYTGSTMKDIAERAGVSFGLVSHYFGSKESLFLAAGLDIFNQIVETLVNATMDAEDGLEAVRKYMTAYFDFTDRNRKTFPVLLRCSPFSYIEPGVDVSSITPRFHDIINTLRSCVTRGREDGSIRDISIEAATLLVYGNIVGAVRTKMLTPYDTENIYNEAIEFTLCGLTPTH